MAILLYPRANWLFVFVLLGIEVLVLTERLAKDPTPQALADEIERLLTGTDTEWDVDNFESHRIRDPQLKELWSKSMLAGPHPAPEEWVGLDEEHKDRLRKIESSERWEKRAIAGRSGANGWWIPRIDFAERRDRIS